MTANNRSIAKSAHTFADIESCLATIHTLRESLPLVVGQTVRNQHLQWVWRVRVNDEVMATAARSYPRQVRAQLPCNTFLQLVADTVPPIPVRVLYR